MNKYNISVTFALSKEIIKKFLYMITRFTVFEPKFCNSLNNGQCL